MKRIAKKLQFQKLSFDQLATLLKETVNDYVSAAGLVDMHTFYSSADEAEAEEDVSINHDRVIEIMNLLEKKIF